VLVIGSLATGCSYSNGEPYGLLSASLDAGYRVEAGRDAGEGWQKLASEYQVRLTRASLDVDVLELLDAGDAAIVTFDPASPPPGYSLCHDGHCHRDDGSVVDYAEVEADIARAVGAHTVKVLTAGRVDLSAAAPVAMSCEGDCVLDRGHLVLVRLVSSGLHLEGEVRDGLASPRIAPVGFVAEVALLPDGGVHEEAIDIVLDDDSPPGVSLALSLPTGASLLDAVPFHATSPDSGVIYIDDGTIATRLSALELTATVARHDL
jgi:hypothetical protein